MEALLALLFTFGLMYLLLIRPQQRRMRAHQAVVSALEAGDEVVTAGGIHGTITSVGDDAVRLEIAPGVVIRVQRGGVSQRVGPFAGGDDDDDDEEYDDDDEYDGAEDEDDGVEDGDDGAEDGDDVVEEVEVKAEERPDGTAQPGPGAVAKRAPSEDDS